MGQMQAKQRLYLTADKGKVVAEGDKRAATLYAAVGDFIPDSAAERFGLVDGAVKGFKAEAPAAPPVPPAPPAAPATAAKPAKVAKPAKAVKAAKGGTTKEAPRAPNKEAAPGENKQAPAPSEQPSTEPSPPNQDDAG